MNLLIFSLQETYNTWFQERYENDLSTYPKLDLEIWLAMDLIEIKFTVSQTLQPRTSGLPKVFQLIDACNQF